jgi:hypothetical protein
MIKDKRGTDPRQRYYVTDEALQQSPLKEAFEDDELCKLA